MRIWKVLAGLIMPRLMLSIEGDGGVGGGGAAAASDGGGSGSGASASSNSEPSSLDRALELFRDDSAGDGSAAAAGAGAAAAGDGGSAAAAATSAAASTAPAGDGAAAAAAPAAAAATPAAAPAAAPEWKAPDGVTNNYELSPESQAAVASIRAMPEGIRQAVAQVLGENNAPKSPEQFVAVLEDAKAIYDIADGKQGPEGLLSMLQQNFPDAFQKVVDNVVKMAGLKLEGASGVKDPAIERIEKLELERQQEREERAQRERQEVQRRTYDGHVGAVAKEFDTYFKGLEAVDGDAAKDLKDLTVFLASSAIAGNPEILKRMEAGNYADSVRLFNEVNNRLIKHAQAIAKWQISAKERTSNGAPKTAANGNPPAPAATPKKFNPADPDERMAAAMEEFNNPR